MKSESEVGNEDAQQDARLDPAPTAITSEEIVSLGPDHVLQTIVDLVNISTMEFGITLVMSGFLLSGVLVSGKAFFEGMAAEMADAYSEPETSDAIRKYFLRFGNTYDKIEDDEDRKQPIFVHIRDAKLFHHSGKPIPGNRGVWWRGRLSHVAGFNMGTLSADEK